MELLEPAPGKRILDGTFGRGGHSRRLLEAGASVWALDRDPEAVAAGKRMEQEWGAERFTMTKMNFAELGQIGEKAGGFDGILLDLGVSSPQLDQGARGFSFQHDGPLDMRMDTTQGRTAADLVNTADEGELSRLIFNLSGERMARPIARAIVRERLREPIATTGRLAAIVEKAAGGRRGSKIHPATKTFQALRIEVNGELDALESALDAIPGALCMGGRMAVISFHELEDRMVKRFIARRSEEELREPGQPFGRPNPDFMFAKLGRRLPSDEETARNPRARSARVRGAEKIR
jgi:16S rRNA (cytosine1402-N4)-methyltransferase